MSAQSFAGVRQVCTARLAHVTDNVAHYRANTGGLFAGGHGGGCRFARVVGDDFRERKLTLPVIKAVALADAQERAFWTRTIAKGDQQDGDLEQAMAIMARHATMEAARQDALAWAAQAVSALDDLPDHPLREMLADLADYVVSRIN